MAHLSHLAHQWKQGYKVSTRGSAPRGRDVAAQWQDTVLRGPSGTIERGSRGAASGARLAGGQGCANLLLAPFAALFAALAPRVWQAASVSGGRQRPPTSLLPGSLLPAAERLFAGDQPMGPDRAR